MLKWMLDLSKMKEHTTEVFECVILLKNQYHCITLFLPQHLHWHPLCQPNVLGKVQRRTIDRIIGIIRIKIFIIICVLLQSNILKATKMFLKPTTVGKTSFCQKHCQSLCKTHY